MNPVTIGMDILLATLLLAALGMGLRLNGRLKALRDSHQGFAIAVHELDAAATKADSALKALHAASETAHDDLLARIDTARSLAIKLEKLGDAAEKAARRVEAATAAAPPAAPAATSATATPHRSLGELLGGGPSHAPRAVEPEARPAPLPPRRRPIADEDLFDEAEAGARPGLSGLMRLSLGRTR